MKAWVVKSDRTICGYLPALPLPEFGFDLASDQNLTGSPGVAIRTGTGNAITHRVNPSGNLYDWGDVNGDGPRTDPEDSTATFHVQHGRLSCRLEGHV